MKQLLFAGALILSMAVHTVARPAAKNKELVNGLITAAKSAQEATLKNEGLYRKSSFLFNGKTVSAFTMQKEMN